MLSRAVLKIPASTGWEVQFGTVDPAHAVQFVRWLSCPPMLRPALPTVEAGAWPGLIAYAESRGLRTAAYYYLLGGSHPAEPMAQTCATGLRQAYVQAGISVGWLRRELGRVTVALHHSGIRPVLLKGPHVGTLLYEDAALRPFDDLDLWVEPGELARAGQTLGELGYLGEVPESPLDPAYHQVRPYRLYGPGRRLLSVVDLHYRPSPDFLPLPDEAGVRRRALDGKGFEGTAVLDLDDLLIYLCVHAARHMFVEAIDRQPDQFFRFAYRHLGEIARLAVGHDLDWKTIARRIESSPRRRALVMPLRLIEVLWDLRMPPAIRRLWHLDLIGGIALRKLCRHIDLPWTPLAGHWLSFWLCWPGSLGERRYRSLLDGSLGRH